MATCRSRAGLSVDVQADHIVLGDEPAGDASTMSGCATNCGCTTCRFRSQANHLGLDPQERERWRDHPCYQATVDFCENYDQSSFDPHYQSEPLAFFEPMVRRVLDDSGRGGHA